MNTDPHFLLPPHSPTSIGLQLNFENLPVRNQSLSLEALRQKCLDLFQSKNDGKDPSHDLIHTVRVDDNQIAISAREGGDQEILIPGAYLHDIVNYPKDDPRRTLSAQESAQVAADFLGSIPWYPAQKIPAVVQAIRRHSFSAGLPAESLEDAILQDADRLESIGMVALMRVFASCGVMGRQLFDPTDPFCEQRLPDPSRFGLDVYYSRLVKIEGKLNTQTAKVIGRTRVESMRQFIEALRDETIKPPPAFLAPAL